MGYLHGVKHPLERHLPKDMHDCLNIVSFHKHVISKIVDATYRNNDKRAVLVTDGFAQLQIGHFVSNGSRKSLIRLNDPFECRHANTITVIV